MSAHELLGSKRPAAVLWQDGEDMPGEPAILVQRYSDTLCLTQEGRTINISPKSCEELMKLMRKLLKEPA